MKQLTLIKVAGVVVSLAAFGAGMAQASNQLADWTPTEEQQALLDELADEIDDFSDEINDANENSDMQGGYDSGNYQEDAPALTKEEAWAIYRAEQELLLDGATVANDGSVSTIPAEVPYAFQYSEEEGYKIYNLVEDIKAEELEDSTVAEIMDALPVTAEEAQLALDILNGVEIAPVETVDLVTESELTTTLDDYATETYVDNSKVNIDSEGSVSVGPEVPTVLEGSWGTNIKVSQRESDGKWQVAGITSDNQHVSNGVFATKAEADAKLAEMYATGEYTIVNSTPAAETVNLVTESELATWCIY